MGLEPCSWVRRWVVGLGRYERLSSIPSLTAVATLCSLHGTKPQWGKFCPLVAVHGGASLMYKASLTRLSLSSLAVSRILTSFHSMLLSFHAWSATADLSNLEISTSMKQEEAPTSG